MARAEVVWVIQSKKLGLARDGKFMAVDSDGWPYWTPSVTHAVKFSTRASARSIIRRESYEDEARPVERTVG